MVTIHCVEFEKFLKRAKKQFESRWTAEFNETASIDDFNLIKTLGTGSFGRVMLVKHKAKNQPMAMKMLEKQHVVKTKQVQHTISEIRIMDAISFDFLISLEYYFKDNVYIFLCMPFINGGEMFTHLRQMKKFDENLCRFYAGQVILTFEYLHFIGIVYRDLKPENILIDREGYLKVTDYGFCKKIDEQRTYTLCGTPEYLAPEIILSKSYNFSVDWWSLGVLVFEMAAGFSPFYARDPMAIYEKIVSGRFSTPQHFSKALRDLVHNMLQVDRSKRFGMLKNGAKDIKTHEWYKGFDWDALWQRKLKPIYKPRLAGPEDTSNFDYYPEEPIRKNAVEEYPHEFEKIVVKEDH